MATLEGGLSPSTRLQFATRFPHLPAAQRVALLQPVVAGTDPTLRYQAVLSLGDIRHPDAARAIHGAVIDSPFLRAAQTIALAEQGEPASLETLGAMLDTLDNYTKVPAALALARAGDARGSVQLDELMRSPVDLQRIMAASAVTQLNRETAAPAILTSLTSGGPAIRPLALQAAALAHLGRDRAVYTHLVGGEPATRAAAVAAIAETLTAVEPPASERPPAPAPPPLPTTR
jgi:HEAT repeat protein